MSSKFNIQLDTVLRHTLGEKCPYAVLFWSAFSRIPMRENADQNNSEYGQFLGSDTVVCFLEEPAQLQSSLKKDVM